jgi:hypothetical protein
VVEDGDEQLREEDEQLGEEDEQRRKDISVRPLGGCHAKQEVGSQTWTFVSGKLR